MLPTGGRRSRGQKLNVHAAFRTFAEDFLAPAPEDNRHQTVGDSAESRAGFCEMRNLDRALFLKLIAGD